MKNLLPTALLVPAALLATLFLGLIPAPAPAATPARTATQLSTHQPPRGEKSSWHGFDRYDYVIDEATLQITPVAKSADEGEGVAAPAPGTRRCIVVVPREAAPGNPWTWRGCYWDHEPQSEPELRRWGLLIKK